MPLAFLSLILAGSTTTAIAQEPVDRFVAGLQADSSWPVEARELIRKTWSTCDDCDGEEFLTQGLAVLSETFRRGLDAYDADRYGTCASVMATLRDDANPFIAANAAAYEIKSLVAMDRLLEASERIKALTRAARQSPVDNAEAPHAEHPDAARSGADRIAAYSYFAAEIEFLRGYGLLADLQYDKAASALNDFLSKYPDASQRLNLAARQMLAELANRQPGRIGEVVDLMNYSGRRLASNDASTRVQGRQQRIIELLDRLIQDAEQQEQSGGGGGGGGSGGSPGQSPRSPMQESQLPGGSPSQSPLRDVRRANPGEAWGGMPPAQRERILQTLRDSFPGRYRRLVEQYYEQLAKDR
ncbi:MAG: hypothetical protein IIB60_01720 [Planctomycetes bacterium]|nr:hypothetical protein [Planctomycetota bacterium]